MGFTFKRVDVIAGSAEFPTGEDTSLQVQRAKTILQKCVQAIIDCNCGWSLDERSYVNGDLVYTDIPCGTSNKVAPSLFLINTLSGCKLFICYVPYRFNNSIKDFSGTGDVFHIGSSGFLTGLCVSMIPEGSSNVFGDPTTTTFIPSDATRIISTNYNNAWKDLYGYPAGGNPSTGYYSWGIFVNEYVISVSAGYNVNSAPELTTPCFAVGKVFGSLVHNNDTYKYGVINFRDIVGNYNNVEGMTGIFSTQLSISGSSNTERYIGIVPYTLSSFSNLCKYCASVCKADGSVLNSTDGTNYGTLVWVSDVSQLSGYMFNSTDNKSRWLPFEVSVFSTDLSTYGIVDGDGFKGYLDTSLFRCALGTYGKQFDNGNFICVDSTNHLLLGWDASNTDSIAW